MKKLLFPLLISTQVLAAPIPDNEKVSALLEGQREIRSLSEMAKLGLNEGETSLDLWSSSYWPHFQGSVAVRYRESEFMHWMANNGQFEKFKKIFEGAPLYTFMGRENILSPAEKYDLLIGDREMSLTKYAWEIGEKASIGGKVKTWRGLCDGWASGSQMMPRPVKTITLNTPEGTPITFYPEDVKALGSLMYARSQGPVIFIGKRCRGALIGVFNNSCKGTNPAVFHGALVNRVGKLKKSFIADISPNSEVWNYPVESYKISYYNVFTDEESNNFEEVKELFDKKKKFAKKNSRHKSTHSIVGVKVTVNFRDMKDASLSEFDSKEFDKTLTKKYEYDLELDRYNNILGGEASSWDFPDFIWAPNDKTYPLSDIEESRSRLPLVEQSRISSKKGQPLSQVVEKLFTKSIE